MTETPSDILLAAAAQGASHARYRLAVASALAALDAECLSRSQEAIARSRELLAIPVYPPLRRATGTPASAPVDFISSIL